MGCLLDLFFELFFEGLVELIVYLYMKIVSWILPEHKFSEKLKKRLRNGLEVFSAIMLLSLMCGIGLLIDADPAGKTVGAYMTYIPLGIIVAQLLLGIIIKVITIIRRKNREMS